MKLFYYPGACSLVSHIALEEVRADYELVLVDLPGQQQLSPEYLRINPAGRVPALETERGIITENPAILAFLALTHPDAGLAPVDDPHAFAQMQAFQIYIATTIHVLFRQIARPDAYGDGEAVHAALKAKVPEMSNDYFSSIEQRMADGRTWVHGETWSASDIYLYVYSSYLKIGDRGDPSRIPAIWSHRQRVRARAAVDRALGQEASGAIPLTLFD